MARSEVRTQPNPVRVIIQQPALPAYRVPVFAQLARRAGIRLKVLYGQTPGLPNAEPDGFEASHWAIRSAGALGQPVYWHTPQWRFATRKTTDVLVLTWNLRFASLLPALIRARRHGVATILWGHGYSKQDSPWRCWPRHRIGRLATAVLFYSQTAADRYTASNGPSQRVFVAPNSIDQTPIRAAKAHWSKRPDQLAEFRREHALTQGPVVLFLSRLGAQRRLDLLVDAVAELQIDFPTLQVVIIGEGQEKQNLLRQAAALGVEHRLRFVGALYDELQLAPWFLCADVFCFPRHVGLSLLRAFGYGLPVVTTDDTQAQGPEIEALSHGLNGWVYADGDSRSLAEALRRLFGDRDLLERLSRGAVQTVNERYDVQQMVDGMESAIRFCLKQAPPARPAGGT